MPDAELIRSHGVQWGRDPTPEDELALAREMHHAELARHAQAKLDLIAQLAADAVAAAVRAGASVADVHAALDAALATDLAALARNHGAFEPRTSR